MPKNKQIRSVDSKQIQNKDLSSGKKEESKDTVRLSHHYKVYISQEQNTLNHTKGAEPSGKKNSRSAEAKAYEKEVTKVQKNRTDSFERSGKLRNGENMEQNSGYERHIAQLRQSNILNQGNFTGFRKSFYSQGELSKNEGNRIEKQQSSGKDVSTSAGRTVSFVKKIKLVKKQKSNKTVDKKRNVSENENKTVKKKSKTIKVRQIKYWSLSSDQGGSSNPVLRQNIKALTKEAKKIIKKDIKELEKLLSGYTKLGQLDIAKDFETKLHYINQSSYLDKRQKQKAILQESIKFVADILKQPGLDNRYIEKRFSGFPDSISNQFLTSFVGKRKLSKEEVEFYSKSLANTAEKGMIALGVLTLAGGSSVSSSALSKLGASAQKIGASAGSLSGVFKNIFKNPGSIGVSGDGTLVLTGAAEGELVAALAGSLGVVIELGESLSAALGITGNNKSGSSHSTQKQINQEKIIDDLKNSSQIGRRTKGKSKQYEKIGGYSQALKDFESLDLDGVYKSGKTILGRLEDGRIVNVRPNSSFEKPTLEIYNPKNDIRIKFRYF